MIFRTKKNVRSTSFEHTFFAINHIAKAILWTNKD